MTWLPAGQYISEQKYWSKFVKRLPKVSYLVWNPKYMLNGHHTFYREGKTVMCKAVIKEEVKRLSPKKEVLRELYMKSGNECAFPGCHNVLINENGIFVGEVCHIEAALPGGERFNPYMTNEERRSYDNLILMCPQHHIITNDVQEYTVEILKQMKRTHEARYSGGIGQMENSVIDYGVTSVVSPCRNCKRLSNVLEFGLTDEENRENAAILNNLLEKLRDLPIGTRKFLGIMVMRSYESLFQCIVPIHEIEKATGLDQVSIRQNVDILARRGISSDIDVENDIPLCTLSEDLVTGWPYWNDIREFSKKTGISIENICVYLDFSVFDES